MAEGADGAVDFAYLERFAAGDAAVIAEVFALFRQQAAEWRPRLRAGEPGWRDVAHTIKGSARGIGANGLGEAAARAEEVGPEGLPQVVAALDDVLAAIAAYEGRRARG